MTARLKTAFLHAAAIVLALCLYATSPQAQAQELTRFNSFDEPINLILGYIKAGDMDAMDDFLDRVGFGDPGRIGSTFLRWLGTDRVVTIDLLTNEELGKTVKRVTYAITDSTDSLMFVRFYVARVSDGWVLYNFNFNTDLSTYFPGWEDP